MIKTYLLLAYRRSMKNKSIALINILGLSVGIAAFFLVLQYTNFETSFDQFHENKDEIYRIAFKQYENSELKSTSAKSYYGMREILEENFPEIKSYTGFIKRPANTGFLFGRNDKLYNESGLIDADLNFFKVFPSLLVRGDINTSLNDPHNLVISESMSKKIFGEADPMGQRINRIEENQDGSDYIITGIMKDIPENSHFHINFVKVVDFSEWKNLDRWRAFIFTYVTLGEETDRKLIANRINRVNSELEKENPEAKGIRVFLQPITDIHLHSNLKDEFETNGNEAMVYILYAIGLIILITAWINYVNIETARLLTRIREAGVRRVIGSGKGDLALQFLVEYVWVTLLAIGVAWVLLGLVRPYFTAFTGIPITQFELTPSSVWLSAGAIFICGSIVVGIYPALIFMKLNPANAVKGNITGVNTRAGLRKSLVVVQFTVSIVLIAFLVVIYRQLEFMQLTNKKIALDKVVAIRNPTAYRNQEGEEKRNEFNTLKNKLLQNPAIATVGTSSAIPGTEIGFTYVDLIKRNIADPYDPTPYKTLFVDYGFIPAYGLKLLAGRNYAEENGEDQNWETLILNESAIHALGFASAEDAVGKNVNFMVVENWDKFKIIGVVEDYHHEAVKKDVFPTIFYLSNNLGQQVYYSIRINAGKNPKETIGFIKKSWNEIFPEKPFDYFFLDDYYDQQFKSEMYFGRLFAWFAGIAIFIACLGILGMTIFEANTRLKEISIRKVLGASTASLVALLSRKHFMTVLLSMIIAMPLIYFVATQWLSAYPVRIEFSFLFLLIPCGIIVILVFLVSGSQTVKAANTNPVDHLKNE